MVCATKISNKTDIRYIDNNIPIDSQGNAFLDSCMAIEMPVWSAAV